MAYSKLFLKVKSTQTNKPKQKSKRSFNCLNAMYVHFFFVKFHAQKQNILHNQTIHSTTQTQRF